MPFHATWVDILQTFWLIILSVLAWRTIRDLP